MTSKKKSHVEEHPNSSHKADKNEFDPTGSGSTSKDQPISGGKHPSGDHSGPFEQQQDPKRRVGQYTGEGVPPQMKK